MENPYQAPAASVEQITVSSDLEFFPVSITKLIVLSIFTLGFYDLYWFYKNWSHVKRREKSDISPFWRAFFAFFTCYSLFSKIRDELKGNKISMTSPGLLATGWIIFTILSRLPDPYWLISIFSFVFLIPIQTAINSANQKRDPGHDRNSRFTAWNIVTILIGGSVIALALIGTFLPEDQA